MSKHKITYLYEINTRVWLRELSKKYRISVNLGNIPDEEIIGLKRLNFDAVWLMGVWKSSQTGRNMLLENNIRQEELREILPDLKTDDIACSPYAIAGYEIEPNLGNRQDILNLKKRLNQQNIKLILDFVPNHLALDHPWLKENSDYFILGSEDDLKKYPKTFFKLATGDYIFAHGKDPNFPAWQDVVQLNYFNPRTREAVLNTLADIAGLGDGVRCDMAMLILKTIQKKIWQERVFNQNRLTEPAGEFWPGAIEEVKRLYPDFIFIAEVYWGLENKLINLGFDYVYDKKFYDALKGSNIEKIKESFKEAPEIADKKFRFIENHDEERAMSAFGLEKSKAAALLTALIPGAHLFHQGQFEGFKIKLPIELLRRPPEKFDEQIFSFYENILLNLKEISDDETNWLVLAYQNFIGLLKNINEVYYLAAVNFSDSRLKCFLRFDIPATPSGKLFFKDIFSTLECLADKLEIISRGLYLDLPSYGFHLFKITAED